MKVVLAVVIAVLLAPSPAAGQGVGGAAQESAAAAKTSPDLQEAARLNGEVVKFYAAGKYEEALAAARRVLELREKELGRTDRLVAEALVNVAAVEVKLGKSDDARGHYKRAIDILEKGSDGAAGSLITAVDGLARLESDIYRAVELHKRSLALKEKTYGPESPDAASSVFTLGHLAELLGQGGEAEGHFKRFIEINEKRKAGAEDDVAVAYLRLACLAAQKGREAEASALNASAMEVFKRAAEKRLPVDGGVVNGKAVSKPQPVYPREAARDRAEGTIVVAILVGETGVVLSACAETGEGHLALKRSSESAAYSARFTPTLVNGKPVKVKGVITYRFVLR